MEDIAVVGLGLRFPGNATGPEELWDVLSRKESQWSEFPKDRLNIDGYYHPSGRRQGGISFRGGHFLKDDVSAFDAPFFSIPTEEANAIDPQQRMLLEVSYEALENAGIRKEDIDGSDAAVYVGSFVKDYEQICLRDPDWSPQYAATGNGIAIMANRISYALNLHGPSMTIDTGCSGSLIAVHLAAQSLRTGESSLALAAGAGMILTPNTIMPMTALNFLSPDGKCFTFDSRANGYGRGEGIGVVVLKRLSDALRDNDTIHAVIRATSTNQDGRTPGITLPSKDAQVANIRSVYASAGLDFNQTAYVECHGTGTQAGDWRELKAISETIASVRSIESPIVVGSVKTNIGHLEGAAGIAGLIKGVLALEHGQIPPNINFLEGNPDIDFKSWKIRVPTEMLDWPIPGVRRVSVNCFGFGGSNAHVVMDEAPRYLSSRGLKGNHSSEDELQKSRNASYPSNGEQAVETELHLLVYSAQDKQGVSRVVNSHLSLLEQEQDKDTSSFLKNYAYTLACRRSNLEWKGFAVADSYGSPVSKLKEFDNNAIARSSLDKKPKICFLFCGQGAQWAQMGKDLMHFRIFSASLTEASSFMQIALASPFILLEEIFHEASQSRMSNPEISQPATTALQIALIDLLQSFGIQPKYVVGHSSGEIAAAYASGAISRYDAWRTAYYRGLAAASIPIRAPKLRGGMMAIGMSLEDTIDYLLTTGKSAQVACINSPKSITISGQSDAIHYIYNDLRQRGIFCKILDVKVAYHSSHMKLVEYDYMDCLDGMVANRCHENVKMFSSVTGELIKGPELGAKYWARNMVSPVQYVKAIESLMGLGTDEQPDFIIEVSPGAALRSPTTDCLADIQSSTTPIYYSVLNRRENGPLALLKLVGQLWCQGCAIDMKSVISRGQKAMSLKCLSNLPSYPWNHGNKYWHESHLSLANRFREYPRQDLIGARTADSIPFEPRWRGFLRIPENPWIQDHQVQKTVIYPAAGMVSMILEAAHQMSKSSQNILGYELTDMRIEKAMLIPNTAHGLEVALNMKTDTDITTENGKLCGQEFSIYSKPLGRSWERNASGRLHFHYKDGDWETSFQFHETRFKDLSRTCNESVIPRQLYEHLDAIGMNYGPLFQNIYYVRKGNNSCVSKIRIPDTKSKMPSQFEYPHLIHPTVLDSMFQTLLAIEPRPMVPVFIRSLFVSANLRGADCNGDFAGYSIANVRGIRDAEATIAMQQSGSDPTYIVIDGLCLTELTSPSPQDGGFIPNHRNLCTQIVWKEDADFASPLSFDDLIAGFAHKHPALAVLQVGPSRQLTRTVLRVLASDPKEAPYLSRYTIYEAEDDGVAFASSIDHSDTRLEPYFEKTSDLSSLHADYHLIIVCPDTFVDIKALQKRLKPGGVLLKHKPQIDAIITFEHESNGFTTGDSNTHLNTNSQVLGHNDRKEAETEVLLLEDGIETRFVAQKVQATFFSGNVIVLLPSEFGDEVQNFIKSFKQPENTSQSPCNISYMNIDEVLREPTILAGTILISLLDCSGLHTLDRSVFQWNQKDFDAFQILTKHAKGILWITRGAHMNPQNPRGSPIVALARTIMSEDPLNAIATLDLGVTSRLSDQGVINNIFSVLNVAFGVMPNSSPREMEFAEDGGKLFIPRLTTIPTLNQLIEDDIFCGEFISKDFSSHQTTNSKGTKLRLNITKTGIDDTSIYFTEFEARDLAPDEVEIAFSEAPLTFLDLETVIGRNNESTIGIDVKGKVNRVGNHVHHLAPGDDVVALVSDGGFQNVMHVKAQFVKPVDSEIIPSLLINAYYALLHVGRVGKYSKVLIHAGASAFGLIAVDLALAMGAEVFATVTGQGSSQQRDALEKHGLPESHILDAKSGCLVATIRAATGGRGVDLLYNPTFESVDVDFKCIRNCGGVVQFASRSSVPQRTRMATSSMTMVNLDLRQLLQEDAEFVARLFELATQLVEDLWFDPRPSTELKSTFDIGRLPDGLKHLQDAPYLNLTSIVADRGDLSQVRVLNKNITKPLQESIDAEGSYVLAGGLGGLGRTISELLVNNGAKNLVFLSRSGATSEPAVLFVESLKKRGINVQSYAVDICDADALNSLIRDTITADMPPVHGVFQCAAVIRDAVFDNMTFDDWDAAIKPKTVGSWNLVQAMATAGQDPFYIFLASSAGVIGNRGQANYAAGNCFEDSLARHLQQNGTHAVAVDLGPVLGAGMLAEDERILDILRANGFYGIRHGDFLKVIQHAITGETVLGTRMPAQVTLGVGTGGIIRQNQPADPYWSRTALYSYLNLVDMPPPDLTAAAEDGGLDTKSMLYCAPDIDAAAIIVCNGLSHMLAKAMNMLPEEIDVERPPNAYGVDSLVAVGVRSWVLSSCGVQISVFEILSDSTIMEMSKAIAEKGRYGAEKTD